MIINFNVLKFIRVFLITILIFITLHKSKAEVAFSFDEVNLVSVINILSPEIGETIIIDESINESHA